MNWDFHQHRLEANDREARARKQDLVEEAQAARRQERLRGYWERIWKQEAEDENSDTD